MCQSPQGLVTQIDSSGVRSFSQALVLTSELSLDESLDTKVMYKLYLGSEFCQSYIINDIHPSKMSCWRRK